jgi:choice-of-anchor C domain-containing protein
MHKNLLAGVVLAASVLAGSASAATNLIQNGHFIGPNPNGSFVTVGAGSSAIPEWDVLAGNVDWIQGYWAGSDGDGFSIDLNGTTQGTIGQSIDTVIGKHYTLTFDIAANPDFSGLRVAIVGANGTIGVENYSLNQGQPVAWSPRALGFTANSTSTLITFSSGNPDNCCYGAAIDNVAVGVPEPATWALMIMGFGSAGAMLRRRRPVTA